MLTIYLNDNTTNTSENDSTSNNHCFLISDDNEVTIDLRYIIYGPILFFVILFGALGNVLTFFVFQKQFCGRKQRQHQPSMRLRVIPKMHRYLAVLSVWDFLLIVNSFFLYNLPYLMYGRVRMYGPYVHVYPYAYAMACASRTGGIWILIASAVDRYFAVCHPFAHHIYSTTRRTNILLATCCLLSLLYGWPRYYHLILKDCYDLMFDRWTIIAEGSDIRSSKIYWYTYKIAADFALISVGPFIILLYLSLAVCLAVRRSTKSRRTGQKLNVERLESSTAGRPRTRTNSYLPTPTTNGAAMNGEAEEAISARFELTVNTSIRRHEKSQRRRNGLETQNSLNFMLITVLAKFLICHSLPAVLDVCETIMHPSAFESTEMDDLMHAANTLVVVNCSLNVLLYLICSRRFRLGVSKALFWGLKRESTSTTLNRRSITNSLRGGGTGEDGGLI